MAVNGGGHPNGARIIPFDLSIGLSEAKKLELYVGRDHHLGVVRNGDGTFDLRAYDEYTPGGLLLSSTVPKPVYVVDPPITDGILPPALPEGTTHGFLDFDLTSGPVNVSALALMGLADRALVQLRKIDTGPNSLSFTDHTGVTYNFANPPGEFMTFLWLADPGVFRLI